MRPHKLVELLTQKGVLSDPRVAEAFTAVPRELFVPGTPLDQVYSDVALVTKRDEAGMPISSASQPAIVAIMLEQLGVRPGDRVLEVGAGTGYNAALLAHLAGPAGRVVTIDIDEDTAGNAGTHLDAAKVKCVRVRCGDGWLGSPDDAPFDRIELTVGAWDLAPAWRDQLIPDGRLVLPLWLGAGLQLSVAFRPDGDRLVSESVRCCGFQRLRGPHAGPEGVVPVSDELFAVLDDRNTAALIRELLATEPVAEAAPEVVTSSSSEILDGLLARLALDEPGAVLLAGLVASQSGPSQAGLYDLRDPGLTVVSDGRLLSYGSDAARDRLLCFLATASPLDRERLRVTAHFGEPPAPPERGWRLHRPSCVLDVEEGLRVGSGSGQG